MITVGTTVVSGSPINGGGGGGGAPSGTGVVTVTSGVFDTPSSTGAIVNAGVSQLVGSDPAGTAIVSDGAGSIQQTSADVSTLLGAADAAAARAVLNTASSGTLAARPASPTAGDTYEVTSGTGRGRTYQCLRAGLWTRQRSQPIAMQDVPGDWTTTAPATTTVTVTAGNITTVLASGSNGAYASAGTPWPAGVNQFRVQYRVQLTTTDANAANYARFYLDYNGSMSPFVMVQFGANGALQLNNNGNITSIATGISLATSPWVAIEVQGATISVWYCINTSDDESLCVWILGMTVTLPSLATKGAPAGILVNSVAEGGACTASVTAAFRNVTIRDLA